jgi:hypothetical protein
MNTKLVMIAVLLLSIIAGCKNETKKKAEQQFVLHGTIEGITNGELNVGNINSKAASKVQIVDGKFTITGNYPEPTYLSLFSGEPYFTVSFFAENKEMTMHAKVDGEIKLTGSKIYDEFASCDIEIRKIKKKHDYDTLFKRMYMGKLSDKEMKENEKAMELCSKEIQDWQKKYIQEHPASYYSLMQAYRSAQGAEAGDIEKKLGHLDPSLEKTYLVKILRKKIEDLRSVDVSLEQVIKNVKNVNYKVDKSFTGVKRTEIIYLAMLKNSNICGLKANGTLEIISANGKLIKTMETGIKEGAKTVAVDAQDQIYVLENKQKVIKKKVRGRSSEYKMPDGVVCHVFNLEGKELKSFECAGMTSATGTRVIDNKLIVADFMKKQIVLFDKTSGKQLSKINDMRPCCGILDFSVNKKNELMVANLGAFRVQAYDMTGKKLLAFGKRGKDLDSFHGCCNPVSVATLNSGAIVTVEKDPTRIKVYSQDGAKQIKGIQELVHGCSYIPMIVDANDNLYLASAEKGLVKCIAM